MESNPKHLSLSAQMGCFWSEVIMRAYQQMSLHKQKKKIILLFTCILLGRIIRLPMWGKNIRYTDILLFSNHLQELTLSEKMYGASSHFNILQIIPKPVISLCIVNTKIVRRLLIGKERYIYFKFLPQEINQYFSSKGFSIVSTVLTSKR